MSDFDTDSRRRAWHRRLGYTVAVLSPMAAAASLFGLEAVLGPFRPFPSPWAEIGEWLPLLNGFFAGAGAVAGMVMVLGRERALASIPALLFAGLFGVGAYVVIMCAAIVPTLHIASPTRPPTSLIAITEPSELSIIA